MTALLDVDQLRTFIAIAETGSFTRAADIVHKTQSAVSMQMKRLEERLDRAIFARDGRASKLTEDGERLLDYARRIVKLNVETIAAFSDELTGRVRLGVPDDPKHAWHVEYAHTGRTTLGWVALLEAGAPDRTVAPFPVDSSRRMRDHVSLKILEHRDELVAAVRQRRP